ncbi:MAG: VOC family protein [Verrucomicrobiota bacterium]
MEKVTGIGGFFFLGKNSSALADWYEEQLGIRKPGQEYADGSWWQDEGPTVFGAEEDEAHCGGPGHSWRINFRVRDLNAMVAQLRGRGIAVEVDPTLYPNGRFAYLRDPEGNSIELWQSEGTDATRPPQA